MELNSGEAPGWAVGIAAGVWGLYSLIHSIWRRFSRDSVETAKDRAEVDIVTIQHEQIRELLDENAELRKQAMEAGRLSAKVEMMSAQVEDLKSQISILTTKLEQQTEVIRRLIQENATLRGARA